MCLISQGDIFSFMKLCSLIITELKNLSNAARAAAPIQQAMMSQSPGHMAQNQIPTPQPPLPTHPQQMYRPQVPQPNRHYGQIPIHPGQSPAQYISPPPHVSQSSRQSASPGRNVIYPAYGGQGISLPPEAPDPSAYQQSPMTGPPTGYMSGRY